MKPERKFPRVELAILLFAGWQARDLFTAWQHSPHDRLGWLALLVWLSPIAIRWTDHSRNELHANPFLLGAAIVAGALSAATGLHFFGHVALALALAAWKSKPRRSIVWLLSAVAWMPVSGWCLTSLSSEMMVVCRLVLALGGTCSIGLKLEQRRTA